MTAFPVGMKKGRRYTKEEYARMDQLLRGALAKNPRLSIERLRDVLAKRDIYVSFTVVSKRVRTLRDLASGAEPPVQEATELDTAFSVTPLSDGKMRVVLAVDLEPKWGGAMITAIGAVLASAAGADNVNVSQNGAHA